MDSDTVDVSNYYEHNLERAGAGGSGYVAVPPVYRIGWTGYFAIIKMSFFPILAVTIAGGIAQMKEIPGTAIVCSVLYAAVLWYCIAMLRSIRVFADPAGVWKSSGVFPWQKGFYGVRWADIGKAGVNVGFVGWATGCYRVELTNRYTGAVEMTIESVRGGNQLAIEINHVLNCI